jgi:cation diffusion facilitator family transporter
MTLNQPNKNEVVYDRASLTRFAWLSIGAAILTIGLKSGAYMLTGSVGLLSDAIESVVNLVAAMMALAMLTVAARPADESHMYGHSKAEYFASVVEGILILVAAGGIIFTAVQRLLNPRDLEQPGLGLGISVLASLVNLAVSQILLRAGKKHNSITLEADAHHLMTDVWTSVAVIAAIGIVALTKWNILDPIIAILVGINITWTAYQLMRRSVAGLMDASLPPEEQKQIDEVIAKYRLKGVEFHALRTRQSASRRFMSVHVLVPGQWTVHDAHHVADDFEGDIRKVLTETIIYTHLEPIDDEISMHDVHDK